MIAKRVTSQHGSRQQGYLLLETLVTIAILAVGLLGVIAMQLTSLKSDYSAIQRGEAAILVGALADRMRANPLAFKNKKTGSQIDYHTPVNGTRAAADLAEWKSDIDATFGKTSAGASVAIGSVNCVSNVNCVIQIQWNDPRTDRALDPKKSVITPSGYRYKHIVSVIF